MWFCPEKFICLRLEKLFLASSALRGEVFVGETVGLLYSIKRASRSREEGIKASVMKFMKLGSRPDTFYTAEAVR